MGTFALWLCFLLLGAIAQDKDCTVDVCQILNSFKEELGTVKQQLPDHSENVELKKIERRLRSLEQTSTFYLSQFNNKTAINFVVSLDNFVR